MTTRKTTKNCKEKMKPKKAIKKRNIEDARFYKFEYGTDDLPLDPARQFIQEKIGKTTH